MIKLTWLNHFRKTRSIPMLPLENEIVHIERLSCEIEKIPGMIDALTGKYLYVLASSQTIIGDIVEIGSWQGKSTVYLAKSLGRASRGKVFAIDHFQGNPGKKNLYQIEKEDLSDIKENFLQHMKDYGVDRYVELLDMPSQEAVHILRRRRISIRLLFIDGCHDYEAVKSDFTHYAPLVKKGGLIILDDFSIHFPGVVKFIHELRESKSVQLLFALPNLCVVKVL